MQEGNICCVLKAKLEQLLGHYMDRIEEAFLNMFRLGIPMQESFATLVFTDEVILKTISRAEQKIFYTYI